MALKVMNQALKKAVTLVGGQTALARLIGTKQQNVWQWLYDTGKPMSEHCIAIERATYGRITRYELRPDVFGEPPGRSHARRTRRKPRRAEAPA
jgi:DNA-binding transcriptional regulator YdaS (Cro superfamily)